jgi:segregation and condensation protein B
LDTAVSDEREANEGSFGLDAFQTAPAEEQGLPLDQLTEAYANLIARGSDPYVEAPDMEALPGPPPGEPPAAEAEEAEDVTELDHEDDDACEISPRTILEAMLFVGHPENQPLTSERVASYMRGVRPQEIDELVVELNRCYDDEGCPYRIESAGAGYRMVVRDEFHSLRDKFYGRLRAARLSQAAIDVLAIVAYKQPLTREEVDELRGKPSGTLLTQLVRRRLLRMERPHEKPRTPRYWTTDRFLDLFGLEDLRDLPQSPD